MLIPLNAGDTPVSSCFAWLCWCCC